MKNSNYFICKATLEDIDKIISLEESLDIKILSKTNLSDDIQNEHYLYFILKDLSLTNKKDNVIGYVAISYVIDTIDILSIVIKKDYQRKGLATYLLNFIIDFAKENNVSNILLEVRKSNTAAINLYKKLNFCNISTRKNYYNTPLEDALIYMLNIV